MSLVMNLVLLAHLAGTAIWIGGVAALGFVGIRHRRSHDLAAIHGHARTVSIVGVAILTPAALLVLVSGVWLVIGSDEWTLAQPWVLLGLATLLLAVLLGSGLLRGGASQLELALGSGAPDRRAVETALNSLLRGYALVLVLLVLAALDMSLKPGA